MKTKHVILLHSRLPIPCSRHHENRRLRAHAAGAAPCSRRAPGGPAAALSGIRSRKPAAALRRSRSHVRGSVPRNFSVTEATTTSLTLRGPWVEVAPSVSASFKHLLGRLPSRYLQRATGSIQSGLLQKFNQAAHSMVATAFMIRLHLSRTAALMSMLSFTCRTKDPSIIRS